MYVVFSLVMIFVDDDVDGGGGGCCWYASVRKIYIEFDFEQMIATEQMTAFK